MPDYQHHWKDRTPVNLPLGKIVCIGRNYAEHARELNNPVPDEPLLFIKPATSAVHITRPLDFPRNQGAVHFETELAVLIVIHFRLAELQTEVEALRALTYQACELHVEGKDVTKLASMAKLKAGRLGREVTDSCLQYWGGNGYMWENPLSRAFRDVRLVSIGGGADEIMLGIICKMMGTLPGKQRD